MTGEAATDRTLWSLTGADALGFLQGLVSNDLRPLETGPGIVWAALLTPQGKYLADFFVIRLADGPVLIDIANLLAPATLRRLTMYRLRADVQTAPANLHVRRGQGALPDSYILEAGFERLHGVDFRKGCYVGQEVTARMKHKAELRKGLVRVTMTGQAPVGTPILSGGKEAGTLFTHSHGAAIAYLRHDRIAPKMQAGKATLQPLD